MKKTILTILMCGLILISLTGCGKEPSEDGKKDPQEIEEKYGTVEKETVDVLVAKFNTEVVDNNDLNPASIDYLTEDNNQYWYGLIEGIYLVIVPEKYTGDKATDIVDYMLIYVNKTTSYESNVIPYAKYLIKANNNEITDTEIDMLLKDAKDTASSGKTSNNGKGISVGYLEKDDSYQYQILRWYK